MRIIATLILGKILCILCFSNIMIVSANPCKNRIGTDRICRSFIE